MRKTIVITTLLLLGIFSVSAQSSKTIKLYLNSSFFSNDVSQNIDGIAYNYASAGGSLVGFSPALNKVNANGTYSEIELSTFRLSLSEFSESATPDSTAPPEFLEGGQNYFFGTSFRYEYGFNIRALLGGPIDGLSYSLGLALQPYFSTTLLRPFTSNEFRQGNILAGTRFQLVPRIMFGGKSKWFFDFNFPITLADASFTRIRNDNPVLPLNGRSSWQSDVRFLPLSLQARFGIGIRI